MYVPAARTSVGQTGSFGRSWSGSGRVFFAHPAARVHIFAVVTAPWVPSARLWTLSLLRGIATPARAKRHDRLPQDFGDVSLVRPRAPDPDQHGAGVGVPGIQSQQALVACLGGHEITLHHESLAQTVVSVWRCRKSLDVESKELDRIVEPISTHQAMAE